MKFRELLKEIQPRTAALILLFSFVIPWAGIFGFSLMASGQAVADQRLAAAEAAPPEKPVGRSAAETASAPEEQTVPAAELPPEAATEVVPPVQPLTNDRQGRSTPATAPAAGRNNKVRNIDINLLARVIYAEARGEPFEGQVAVGAVLMNRVLSPKFPDDLWSIVFKRGEFCTVRDGQIWLEPDETAYRAAKLAKDGWDPTNGALYFYNPRKTTSKWIRSRPVTTQIGRHMFAR